MGKEKAGILVVSYGSREAAMIDAFRRSEDYEVRLYVADKQRNPFNVERAEKHVVIPDLDVGKICEFAEANKNEIDFGICGPEKPIIAGVRDIIESKTGIPMICPTKKYALEGSKSAQRFLIQECCVWANPAFKVFYRGEYKGKNRVRMEVLKFLDLIGNDVAVKPDKPAAGKGVGVWGAHFTTREQLFEHFWSIFESGSDVLIEKKLYGEESSFQAFCDGERLVPLPETRDYKRAFDSDLGPNTGGMGSYKDKEDLLPFMEKRDRREEEELVQRIFEKLKKDGVGEELRGIPFYVAFMHTVDGPKILEINSRPGDPEIQNILPVLENDFVDICFRMIEGSLSRIDCFSRIGCAKKATVVMYAVPMDYGGYRRTYSGDRRVDLSGAYALKEKYGDNLRIYPGSMELRVDGNMYALGSRTVCTVGIGETIEEAREISLDGIRNIDGPLWNRWDVGAWHYIERSIQKMRELRGKK